MMYNNEFAVAIKVDGKILRETKDLVKLPFGSEFSVLVKNLNSRRATFTLHIDGTDALDGEKIIVNANSYVELKRFIRNGNMTEGNAFKFVERIQAIEDSPRGIRVDDGIIRIEFWFEQALPVSINHKDIYWGKYYDCYGPHYWNNVNKGAHATMDTYGASYTTTSVSNAALRGVAATSTDVGITVPGTRVDQTFTPVCGFNAESASNVIILRMAGIVGDVEVTEAVTVQAKPKCVTCGKINRATSKYCASCGTALVLL